MSPKFNGGARASLAPSRRQRVPFSLAATAPVPSSQPLKVTEPKEFKFRSDAIYEYHMNQLERQREQDEAALAAARERKALPAPDFSRPAFQPDLVSHKVPATETKPFQLLSSARHADAVSAFQQEVSVLTEAEKHTAASFHARPVPATTYKPDLEYVEPADHTPVVPLRITLESERRALKRQEFDQVMGQKMAQLEVMQETIAKQKLEQENRRMKDLRRKSVEEGGLMFKAKPIVTKDQYPTRAVVAAPLTTPLSPQLRTSCKTPRSSTSSNIINNNNLTSASVGNESTIKPSGLSGGAKRLGDSAKGLLKNNNNLAVTARSEQHSAELAQALSTM